MSLAELLPQLLQPTTALSSERGTSRCSAPGLDWLAEHRAEWSNGELRASLTLDAVDDVRVVVSAVARSSPHESLENSATLPASWRWADTSDGRVLLGDWPAHQLDELAVLFAQLPAIAARAAGEGAASSSDNNLAPLTREQVQAVLQVAPWDAESVAELPERWDLRITVGRQASTVALTWSATTVRCRRVLVTTMPSGVRGDALRLLALRLNGQLKHARLVCLEDELVAESCVYRDELTARTVAAAARAVAIAESRARMSLDILRHDERIAAEFAAAFAPSTSSSRRAGGGEPGSPRRKRR